jgi:D-alanyl-D-alanine carboxypeptidase (penicillin-binding protein 5/6)
MPGSGSRRSLAACAAVCAASSLVALAPAPFARAAGSAARQGRSRLAGIDAVAGMLVNVRTGKDLWNREQAVRRPIASLTKVMTALVVIRAGHLSRRIKITQEEIDYVETYGASNAGLHAGDILTARELLYATLLPSGADAAMALAISYGRGIHAFVRKMNALARRLHMTSTHFTNFDGLQSTDQSTARDLLKLGEAAMREPVFRRVVKRKWYWLHAWPHRHHYLWRNTNLLLKRYPGVIGIKTGWTPVAGECLLFEAVHHKRPLIGVLLDSAPTNEGVTFVDAAKLLNWAFGLHVPIPPPMPPPLRPEHAVGG